LYGGDPMPKFDHFSSPNPLVGAYRTKDDRFVTLMMLQSDRFWPDFCRHVGREDLITDERFVDAGARFANAREAVETLDAIFASRTLEEWKQAFQTLEGVWAPVQRASELVDDPQTSANGYLQEVDKGGGVTFDLVASPVQHDEQQVPLAPAPEHGQHTEEILLELGLEWDEIARGKESGAIL